MKVLLASYWSQPFTGGIYTYLKILKAGLEARGHEVDILAHEPGYKHLYLLGQGRSVTRSAVLGPVSRQVTRFYMRRLPRATVQMRKREAERYTLELSARYFDLGRYDVIHAQDAISARALSRVRPRGAGVVATIHGGLLAEGVIMGKAHNRLDWGYLALEERLGITSPDVTLVPSLWMERYFRNLHQLAAGAVRVVPYGLDVPGLLEAAGRPPGPLPPHHGRKVILCPARLSAVKGIPTLLAAIAILRRSRRDFVCWLAGSGPMHLRMVREAQRLGLHDHVAFLGTRQDVPALLSLADIVVLPSLLDNQPFAVAEAQVVGRPVVATRVGGLPEMIYDGVTGLLVPPRNPAALAGALGRLLGNDSLRLQFAEASRLQGRFHWPAEHMLDATLAAYEEARAKEATRR